MLIKSYPNNRDVFIGAEEIMRWLHGRTSGVFAGAQNAAVEAIGEAEMAVTVTDGTGWITGAGGNGVVWWNETQTTTGEKLRVDIDLADGILDRIDRIIVEWKTTNYADLPEIKVLKGTASSTPEAPALTNNSTVRQISLAKVSVAAGITAITAGMITDERLDPSVCGLVTDGLQIDTTTINAQFSELLAKLQNDISNIEQGSGLVSRAVFTATIPANWTGSGPYTQTVAVAGVLASDMPHVVPVYDADSTTAIAQREAWGCVSRGVAAAGGIQFTCFEDKPETAIPIQIEVMR